METLSHDNLAQWLAQMRPGIHRFCGRIMGSAIDGEDVTQEALARAAAAFANAGTIAMPDAWLFRIANNAAIDALRQRRQHATIGNDDGHADPSAASDARAEVTLGFTAFLPLPPPQRASVVLVDILGYSLVETAAILETSVASVKATLHRGRARLAADTVPPAVKMDPRDRLRLDAYADLFNARAFDALRDLLAADVRLDLPGRIRLDGKEQVGAYFSNYQTASRPWRLRTVLADGWPALLATDAEEPDAQFVIILGWSGEGSPRSTIFISHDMSWTASGSWRSDRRSPCIPWHVLLVGARPKWVAIRHRPLSPCPLGARHHEIRGRRARGAFRRHTGKP